MLFVKAEATSSKPSASRYEWSEKGELMKDSLSLFSLDNLLLFLPLALYLEISEKDPTWVFLASALSIIPLAKLMGESTEALSEYL